jgi:ABC-type phosphate transport system substrate-binding protein
MNVRSSILRPLVAATALVLGSMAGVAGVGSEARAATDPTTLSGQGGSFLEPVVSKLLFDDAANLNPIFGAYTPTDIDSGISAFVGSAPGQFSVDYAVTERPLTAAEAATAKANGRSFAYVPFAATPVAVATLVPKGSWIGSGLITASDFCQHMPLTTTLLGQIFGVDTTSPIHQWSDPRIDCPPGGTGSANGLALALWANLDPSMANSALMSLLDSTPTSKTMFDAGLNSLGLGPLTTDDTPSEKWPYGKNTIPGGDQPLIGKMLNINSQTNAPSQLGNTWQLGATAPISSVWTNAPLGVPWNLSTAAVQNAAPNTFVPPSTAAAEASLDDAALATTSDPTTDNLVTFNANPSNAAAYNNFLMEESYLLVPTNGLPAAKATALAQLVRFAVGPQGQQDIKALGAAPASPAMATADLGVAAQLNAEAATNASATTTSSTTTTTAIGATATTSPATAAAAAADPGAGAAGSGSTGSTDGGSSTPGGGLAFTGSSGLGPLVGTGAALLLAGAILRRRLRVRRVRP